MKKILLMFFFFLCLNSFAQDIWVNGYTRSNGTPVQGHFRTRANSTINDNFSTVGNINPYTGKEGTVAREYYGSMSIPIQSSPTTTTYKDISYISGHYVTNSVAVQKYNPNKGDYDLIDYDTSSTKVYLDTSRNELHYYREPYGMWKTFKWEYTNDVDEYYQLQDVNSPCVLYVSKDKKTIIFWEGKIEDKYTMKYTYLYLKKV